MLYSDVSDKSVEFEGEAEDVVVVAAVPHHEAAVGLPRQDPLSSLARQWTPVPTSLKSEASSDKSQWMKIVSHHSITHVLHSLDAGCEVHIICVRVGSRGWLRGRVVRGEVRPGLEAGLVEPRLRVTLMILAVRIAGRRHWRKRSLARSRGFGFVSSCGGKFKHSEGFFPGWTRLLARARTAVTARLRSEQTGQGLSQTFHFWSSMMTIITSVLGLHAKAGKKSPAFMRFRVFTGAGDGVRLLEVPEQRAGLPHVGHAGPLPQRVPGPGPGTLVVAHLRLAPRGLQTAAALRGPTQLP